jgi:hypothetical protein
MQKKKGPLGTADTVSYTKQDDAEERSKNPATTQIHPGVD